MCVCVWWMKRRMEDERQDNFFFFDGENFQVQKFLFKTIFVTTISYNIQLKDNIPNWEISPQTLSKKEGKKKKDKKKKINKFVIWDHRIMHGCFVGTVFLKTFSFPSVSPHSLLIYLLVYLLWSLWLFCLRYKLKEAWDSVHTFALSSCFSV